MPEVAHEARTIPLGGVAECEPESASRTIIRVDDRIQPRRTARAKAQLALAHECRGDSPAAEARIDNQAKEAPPPAVPDRDQRAGELAVIGVCEEQPARILPQERTQGADVVCRRGRRAGARPEREHAVEIALACVADQDELGIEAPTLADQIERTSGITCSPTRRTCSAKSGRPSTSIPVQDRNVNGSVNETRAWLSPAGA